MGGDASAPADKQKEDKKPEAQEIEKPQTPKKEEQPKQQTRPSPKQQPQQPKPQKQENIIEEPAPTKKPQQPVQEEEVKAEEIVKPIEEPKPKVENKPAKTIEIKKPEPEVVEEKNFADDYFDKVKTVPTVTKSKVDTKTAQADEDIMGFDIKKFRAANSGRDVVETGGDDMMFKRVD
ncbi:Hypothetical_protein [Hexamita inflata]|uniref:Hypothetical_protein n=1 Tax=Hexamita inflata TaxID=28002 RepID=A0ABP1JID5_9EUKA